MNSVRRAAVAVLVGLVLCTVSAGTAAAHNTLRSTSPADGQTVRRAPATVVLTFDEPAIALGTQLVVTGPSGPVQQGSPRLVDNTVSQDLVAGLPAGRYDVVWRVTSADGHPVSGSFAFSATESTGSGVETARPEPSATPSPRSSTRDLPGWAWLLTAIVAVVALGSIGYHLLQRRRGD